MKRKSNCKIILIFMLTLVCVLGIGLFGMQFYIRQNQIERPIRQAAESNEHGEGAETEMPEEAETEKGVYKTPQKEKIPPKESEKPTDSKEGEESVIQGKYADVLADTEGMKENNIYRTQANENGMITVGFGGDILMDDEYAMMAKLLLRGGTIENALSEDLLAQMRAVNIMAINNEFPFTDRGIPTPEKTYTFRADTKCVSYLHDMGVDVVSLANNHAYDFGEIGMLDSFSALENAGIPYIGAGRNFEEASAPIYFIAEDVKIAIVAATQIERLENPDTKEATENSPGVFRCLQIEKLLDVVAEAKENSDFVIVFIHWGTENVTEPDWAQLDQAPKLVQAGADLVVGAHPHCLQGIEYYEDVPVVYSLGNFWFNSKTVDTGLLQADISERGLENLRFIPAVQQDCRTSLVYGEEKARILSYLESISVNAAIDEEGYISQKKQEN